MARLAWELRKLRVEAGSPTYREMARRTGAGASSLAQAAGGERLASLPTLLAYVKACGGDPVQWERRWREAEVAAGWPADDGSDAPYRGLARFEPGDRELFFGRDELITDVLELVGRRRFSALVGASGAGKSSLLRAGVIPALRDTAEPSRRLAAVRVLTPGERPARDHADRVTVGPGDGDGDVLVVVDQFEEVFTLCHDPAERDRFIDLLLSALHEDEGESGAGGGRLRVLIAVRADFYGRCAEHPALAAALRDASLLVGPMGPAELREAVVRPAAAAGLIVERSLTARIVAETAQEPGGLPLMSHALLETWRRRRGRALTEAMYEAAGGIHGAVATTAEDLYQDLSPSRQTVARQILLRLVTPGEGAQDTRRPVPRTELETGSPDTATVLEHLTRARLLTLDNDTVDLAHEALISAWPRYHAWIEHDRERLRLHRSLTDAARTWQELGHDPGALYRGSRLAAARDAFPDQDPGCPGPLSAVESAFLDAAEAARDHEVRAAARTTRRLRALTATLSLLLVLALTASLIAWRQSQSSNQAKGKAVAARQVALSRQLAAQSATAAGTDTELSKLLAVQAYQASPTTEATVGLYRAAATPLLHSLPPDGASVDSFAFSHDGRTLAWGEDDGTIRGADVATGRERTISRYALFPGRATPARINLAFSRDDRTLTTGYGNAAVGAINMTTGRLRTVLPGYVTDSDPASVLSSDGTTVIADSQDTYSTVAWNTVTHRSRTLVHGQRDVVALSPDGHTVVLDGLNGISLWDTSSGRRLAECDCAPEAVAFSADGRTLFMTRSGGTVDAWRWATGRPTGIATTADATDDLQALAVSPDGRLLATGSKNGSVHLWDTASGHSQAGFNDFRAGIATLSFSPDGHTLAAGAEDGTVQLIGTTTAPTTGGNRQSVGGVFYAQHGRLLGTGQYDRTVRLWDAHSGRQTATFGTARSKLPVQQVRSSADGRMFAYLAEGPVGLCDISTRLCRTLPTRSNSLVLSADGRTAITDSDPGILLSWDTTAATLSPVTLHSPSDLWTQTLAMSPDGKTLAAWTDAGTVQLLAAATGHPGHTLAVPSPPYNPTPPPHPEPLTTSLTFSPDGRTLAVSGIQGTTSLWDVGSGRIRATLIAGTSPVTSVALSPDGRTLATAQVDGTLGLWDIATDQTRATLDTGRAAANSLVFSPDGHTLAASTDTGTLTWDLPLPRPAGAVTAICAAVDRAPTPRETTVYRLDTTLPPACPPHSTPGKRS